MTIGRMAALLGPASLALFLLAACGGGGSSGTDGGPPRMSCSEWCAAAVPEGCAGTTDMANCLAGCSAAGMACPAESAAYLDCVGRTTPVCGRCMSEYTALGTCFTNYCAPDPTMPGCGG